jgi:fatty-acyl-CoA synthase
LLFSHPQIADAVVIGVPDEKWGEVVAAVVRPASLDTPPSAAELREWCRERISAHKVPAQWFFTEAYPMTPSGKVQKFVLRDQVDAGQLEPLPVAVPTSSA